MWLCSVVRSCATQDDVNKDHVCTVTTPPRINRSPHLGPSRIYPELRDYETRLALKNSFFEPGTPRESVYRYNWRIRCRGRTRIAEGEASRLGGQQERRDRAEARPDERYTRAGAEDAENRSGSDPKEGERLLLGT